MANLSDQQLAQYAYNAGFRGASLNTAVAVALAESHGDPSQVGDVGLQTGTWGPSVGLWQIRSLNPGHGTAAEQAERNQTANLDPATNAANAYQISNQGTNFNPWSTYTSGAYHQFLNRASTAANQVTSGTGAATGTGATNGSGAATGSGAASGGNSSASGAFTVAPNALTSTASTFSDRTSRLKSLSSQVTNDNVTSSAFGGIPQSQQAYQSHHNALATLAQTIQSLSQRAGTVITGLGNSAENYLSGDQSTAASYQSLLK